MKGVCETVPKSMLLLGGKPFLSWVISWLLKNDIPIVIAAGHLSEMIENFYDTANLKSNNVILLKQKVGLGTGGAIRDAVNSIESETVIIFNGDTIVSFNIQAVLSNHDSNRCPITQIVTLGSNQNEGAILVGDSGTILAFQENEDFQLNKLENSYRASSTGCYVFDKNFIFDYFPIENSSLEQEIMPLAVSKGFVQAYKIKGNVFDFGTPERYEEIKNNTELLINTYGEPYVFDHRTG